ncbi:MAG: hypothetical protein WC953_03520 [Pseudomonas sp.]
MKKLIAPALLILASTIHAQMPAMSEEEMARMMNMMDGLASCIGQLDEQHLEQLGKQAEAHEREIAGLCAAGKRNAAQAKEQSYARKFMADPEYKKIMQCGEAAQSMLPDMPGLDPENDDQHVCDDM